MQHLNLYFAAALISLFVSFWISSHSSIINPDAICYLLGADEIGQSGIHHAMRLCGQVTWPFYSALIYMFSKYTFISLSASAYLLDAVFTLISVVTFIAIVSALGGSRRVLLLAAFVILSAHQFNAVREYIIRDHGYWAFNLLSILFMLRFLNDSRMHDALCFSGSLMIAALFRIEGAVFLVFMPMLVFVNAGAWQKRIVDYLKLNVVTLAVVLAVCALMALYPQQSLEKFGRVPELLNQFTHGFVIIAERFQTAKSALGQYVLPHEAVRDAGIVWLCMLVVLYIWNILSNLSITSAALVIYAWTSGVSLQFNRAGKLVLWGFLCLNLMIAAIFFVERMFFSKRYLIAMTLVFLLWVPFALDKLLLNKSDKRSRIIAYIAMMLLLLPAVGTLINTGDSKLFVREAGSWIAANIPAEAKLYSNDLQLAYYSQHYGKGIYTAMNENRNVDAVLNDQFRHYNYAALRSNIKDKRAAEFLDSAHVPVVAEFKNRHGDHVRIYKISAVK
jgi:hypothetical protein